MGFVASGHLLVHVPSSGRARLELGDPCRDLIDAGPVIAQARGHEVMPRAPLMLCGWSSKSKVGHYEGRTDVVEPSEHLARVSIRSAR